MYGAIVLIVAVFSETVLGAALNGECQMDENCGTIDSFCKNGTCQCIENFRIFRDSCVQVISPKISCSKSPDCQRVLGTRSMCKESSCSCHQFHHEYDGQCIKSRAFMEDCDNDSQCYWGQNMKNRIGCIDGICNCRPGYMPQNHRVCIVDPSLTSYQWTPSLSPVLLAISSVLVYL